MPNGDAIRMSGLRKFAAVEPLFDTATRRWWRVHASTTSTAAISYAKHGYLVSTNLLTTMVTSLVTQYHLAFVVGVGTHNFERVWKDDGIKEPFHLIFIWTVVFSV